MKVLKCAKCKKKIFKYFKVGKGRILNCYKERIVEDYSLREGGSVKCRCGNLIGTDWGGAIKMKPGSFTASGTAAKKR